MYGAQQQPQSMVIYLAHSDGTLKRWNLGQQGSQPQTVG
jgi:mRNA export factor